MESLAVTEEMAELFSDSAVLDAMLAFEIALAKAQTRLGMIPANAAEELAQVRAESLDAAAIARDARDSATIAIPFVKALTASAGFAHYGATSQDLVDTALVLILVRARAVMERHRQRVAARLRTLSDQHAATVMLSRTLLQSAPPTTFGYKAAAWFAALDRSWRLLDRAFGDALQLQLGGASGTLAAYGDRGPELAVELAKELSLSLPDAPWHTHRDRLGALVAACGIYVGSMGKIARDVSLLMQDEIGEVAERGGGSSAMPNKRNPAASALILAAATRVPGMVASYLSAMVQEQERAAGAWQAEWPIVADVIQTTGSAMSTLADMLDGLTVDAERMRANIARTHGSVFAEKATMLLAPKLGRAAAQALVGKAAKGQTLREALAQHPQVAALLSPNDIESIDSPEDYLGAAEFFRQRLLEQED